MLENKNIADKIADFIIYSILILFAAFCVYPVIYTFSIAISEPAAVKRMEVILWPVGLSLKSFEQIFQHEYIGKSYLNSIFYTSVGTLYSLILTMVGAFVLSRKRLVGRNFFMFAIWFTMMFSGGLIPTFLVINSLGMLNTRWAMIIPCAISQYNLIIMRTSMMSIPDSLEESAKMDGANDFQVMVNIIFPVSIPVISTIALFYAVGIWNSYFNAIIYLNDKSKYPLQAILRELLVTFTDISTDKGMMDYDTLKNFSPLGFRGAVIVASILPMMIVYPFIQKYFVKGVMIGSIKG